MLVEMAAQGPYGKSAEAIRSGKEKIDLNHFFDILRDISSDNYWVEPDHRRTNKNIHVWFSYVSFPSLFCPFIYFSMMDGAFSWSVIVVIFFGFAFGAIAGVAYFLRRNEMAAI